MKIPDNHPRAFSLQEREKIIQGLKEGYVCKTGLIAQGRGEAFDYLLGEKTWKEAKEAEKAAVALLLLAKNPIISVNGNTAALVSKEIVKLAEILKAGIEVNLFYSSKERKKRIAQKLNKEGAKEILGLGKLKKIPISSKRGKVDPKGIFSTDVILVPLEDGDRTETLVKMGKKVIVIDLNPLSRSSQKATIPIVNNICRAIPEMVEIGKELKDKKWEEIVNKFDPKKNLRKMEKIIRSSSKI